jgi:NAD(P)-dependent dehydrogenase (short-subunit alcohol dehydrogenase family)
MVIITGGASGIGASVVRAFVENGAKVAFLDQQRETGAALADSLGVGAVRPLSCPAISPTSRRCALRSARFAQH